MLIGIAGDTILVAMKNRWGSIASLLDYNHVAVNIEVREHEIEYVQAMGPCVMLRACF